MLEVLIFSVRAQARILLVMAASGRYGRDRHLGGNSSHGSSCEPDDCRHGESHAETGRLHPHGYLLRLYSKKLPVHSPGYGVRTIGGSLCLVRKRYCPPPYPSNPRAQLRFRSALDSSSVPNPGNPHPPMNHLQLAKRTPGTATRRFPSLSSPVTIEPQYDRK